MGPWTPCTCAIPAPLLVRSADPDPMPRTAPQRSANLEGRRGGGAPGPDRPLHVSADPLVRAAHVEGRLVRAVQGTHRHHVPRAPGGDVALRPGVHAPALR